MIFESKYKAFHSLRWIKKCLPAKWRPFVHGPPKRFERPKFAVTQNFFTTLHYNSSYSIHSKQDVYVAVYTWLLAVFLHLVDFGGLKIVFGSCPFWPTMRMVQWGESVSVYKHKIISVSLDCFTVPLYSSNGRWKSHWSREPIMHWGTRQPQSIFRPTDHKRKFSVVWWVFNAP